MDLLQSFSGMLRISVESADLPGLISALNSRGVPLFHGIFQDEVVLTALIRRRDWKTVSALCRDRGENVKILSRKGLYWQAMRMKERPVLLLGLALLLFLILFLPSRVLFVRVEGNSQVPANEILEAAEGCGICFGASRRAVRSERVKNALLEAMPELQWAGVNTRGCVAVLSVRERAVEPAQSGEGFVRGIVAVRDGIVTSCTATKGDLLCAPGQAVRAGQLLISGLTDCGLTIRATSAEGEVFAQTRAESEAVTPSHYQKRVGDGTLQRKISLLIGKKRINLWKDSGIWDTTCGRIYSEYYVTLPGGFVLPLGIAVEKSIPSQLTDAELTPEEAGALLEDALPKHLLSRMIAGRILSREESLSTAPGIYRLAGEYVCTEMIGRVQREQIGE